MTSAVMAVRPGQCTRCQLILFGWSVKLKLFMPTNDMTAECESLGEI